MRIERPQPNILELKRSRRRAATKLGSYISAVIIWYSVFFASADASADIPIPLELLLYVAPVFGIPEILRTARVVTAGDVFTLNGDSRLIERNDSRIAHFSDVERVQIRVIRDSEKPDEYRLSLVLKNQDKIRIDQSNDAEEVSAAAEDLADMLGVEVTRKGGSGGLSFER